MQSFNPETRWQYLQISDVLDREFSSALSQLTPVLAWEPVMSSWGVFQSAETEIAWNDPPVRIRRFPLQRGYSRSPISRLSNFGAREAARIAKHCELPEETPLVCTTPYHAPVAERWPGPVVYYLTDLIAAYEGAEAAAVRALDKRMASRAELLCPNSKRLAEYLGSVANFDAGKLQIVPNATRRANLLLAPSRAAAALPEEVGDLARPVAGIIGNLSANMDWIFLRNLILSDSETSWVFVGPASMEIADADQRTARAAVMNLPRTRFVGRKPYGELAAYARSFDLAVLPYFKREPTFSGSSTRFYEHLAAGRPMIATPGFAELLSKEPLLHLVTRADEAADYLRYLRKRHFDDGQAENRWLASRQGTWEFRAQTMYSALAKRLGCESEEIGAGTHDCESELALASSKAIL